MESVGHLLYTVVFAVRPQVTPAPAHMLKQSVEGAFATTDVGVHADAVSLEYSKAPNRVPHQRLPVKLAEVSATANVLACIKSFLSDRSQCTYANNFRSSYDNVASGV